MKKIVRLAILLSLSTFFTRYICASDNDQIEKNISFFIQHINAKNFADNSGGEGETTSSKNPFAVKHPSFVKTVRAVLLKKQDGDNSWKDFNWNDDDDVKKLKKEVKNSLEVFFKNNEEPTKIDDVIEVKDEIMLSYLEITDMDKDRTPTYKLIDTLISASESSSAIPVPLPFVIPSLIVGGFITKYNPLDWFKKKKESETSSTTTEGEETSLDPEE